MEIVRDVGDGVKTRLGMLTADGDKPLLVEARNPDAALEQQVVADGFASLDGELGKAIAIPDSAWHEFLPARGWKKIG